MVQRLIVPVDGSEESGRAIDVAIVLARRCSVPVDVVEVVLNAGEHAIAAHRVATAVGSLAVDDVEVSAHVEIGVDGVIETLAGIVRRHPEATMVMSSHGRGRSAGLVGSVTEGVLRLEFGPIIVVGPSVDRVRLDGPIIACVDGSALSEHALPLAAAWAIELGSRPWVIEVNDPGQLTSEHLVEASYPARLSHRLSELSGRPAEYEVLHGSHADHEIADFAREMGATMIVAATHGRTGLARVAVGSTAAGLVRRAPCPVLLVRPPRLRDGAAAEADREQRV